MAASARISCPRFLTFDVSINRKNLLSVFIILMKYIPFKISRRNTVFLGFSHFRMHLLLRCVCFSVLLLCFAFVASAQSVSEDEARARVACYFKQSGQRKAAVHPLTLRTSPASYLFVAGNKFVLVAADDRLPEVLAYGTYKARVIPPALSTLLQQYDRLLPLLPIDAHHRSVPAFSGRVVLPLLSSIRSQGHPYNSACPFFLNADSVLSSERCVVGCVATALEQILTYYQRVYTLQDTLKGWTTKNYQIPDINPGATVDSRLILPHYTDAESAASIDAVARLSYYLGQAVHMNWGLRESGASSYRALEPLKRVFGLKYVHYLDSYKYDPSAWVAAIRNEVESGRPVYCAGSVQHLGGHAFVLDGQDKAGNFHVNWGYGGDYDGYFNFDILYFPEPLGQETEIGKGEGFFANREVLFLHPDNLSVELPDTLQRTGTEIAIDSVQILDIPTRDIYTRIRLFATYPLTTPFALFTNLPSDTDTLRQADYVGITSTTLQPGEAKTLLLHARFRKLGQRILRLTPDDRQVFSLDTLTVVAGSGAQLTFSEPLLTFPSDSLVRITLSVENAAGSYRSGQSLVYEIIPGLDVSVQGTRHPKYIYLNGGESMRDTVQFTALVPGQTYTLLVRSPWKAVRQVSFMLPATTAVRSAEVVGREVWHRLDGLRVARPSEPGFYLRNSKKIIVR